MLTGEYSNSGNLHNSPGRARPVSGAVHDRDDSDADGLPDEARFFLSLGIGKPTIIAAAMAAHRHGTTIERELTAEGLLDADIFYEAIAERLGLPYLQTIDPAEVFLTESIDSQLSSGPLLRLGRPSLPALLVLAPEARRVRALKARLDEAPRMRAGFAIANPRTMRQAVWQANSQKRVEGAINGLFNDRPGFSARVVLSGRQGYVVGVASALLPLVLFFYPAPFLLVLHIALSATYLLAIGFRGVALRVGERQAIRSAAAPPARNHTALPVYTVLVAAYREEDMAAQMIAALDGLNWPKSLLDIKIVCEADDRATIDAIARHAKGSHYEIVEVPPEGPRTKPKALRYALAGARGDFVVVYDAEDRPHPDQLREAHARFAEGAPELACLQAPLTIANAQQSWISAIFALEYAGQFRSLLPLLAHFGLPLPLGGTSNHFRVSALKAAGAWDPFNVTEDADLGIRFGRMGYRCGVLSLPTFEDAPTTWSVWQAQRSRWFKGWLQTILVHMRRPSRLFEEVGISGIASLFLTTGGMLFSALAHPLLAVFILRSIWLFTSGDWLASGLAEQALFGVDVANILGSYCLFALLGRKTMSEAERRAVGRPWLKVPLYWMMLSLAAWKATREIHAAPFLWRKTPHTPSSDKAASVKAKDLRQQKEIQAENHRSAHQSKQFHEAAVHIVAHDGAL